MGDRAFGIPSDTFNGRASAGIFLCRPDFREKSFGQSPWLENVSLLSGSEMCEAAPVGPLVGAPRRWQNGRSSEPKSSKVRDSHSPTETTMVTVAQPGEPIV